MLLGALPPPDSEEYDVIGVIAAVSVPILSGNNLIVLGDPEVTANLYCNFRLRIGKVA